VPPGLSLVALIDGRSEPMCCPGCQAVAETIVTYGLENYYHYRTGVARKPEELLPADLLRYEIYDDQQFQSGFTETISAGQRAVHLLLEDIVCPACTWLIESRLTRLPGMVEVKVNYTSHRATITWREDQLTLGGILRTIHDLGYRAYPHDPKLGQSALEYERKQQLRRLGLAGLLGMQVMMFAIAIYVGDWSGMETAYKQYFNWICLMLSTPVMLYSAAPFFIRAWRDLRILRPGMDVPVALGLAIAYGGSVRATITGAGPVYYDSVVMFVFLLLTARYFEFMARQRATRHYDDASRIVPAIATRLDQTDGEVRPAPVPVAKLRPGDRLLVKPGETIAADGRLITGATTIDESILTGEGQPVKKIAGDPISGGSTNIDTPIEVEVVRVGRDTVLAHILQLAAAGQQEKTAITRLTNRVATVFVIGVLLLAVAVAAYWWWIDPAMAVPVTISLLVITCPCALSLATPVAVTAATSRLLGRGLVIINPDALELLNRATHFIFDKTGTLTEGRLRVHDVRVHAGSDRELSLARAAALESRSEHPVARAILEYSGRAPPATAQQVVNYPGSGITGVIAGMRYYLGTAEFVQQQAGVAIEHLPPDGQPVMTPIVLADTTGVQCVFLLADALRPGAEKLIADLQLDHRQVVLLSGDAVEVVRSTAAALGIRDYHGRMTPAAKLEQVAVLATQGVITAVIGDGINDAPVLARAHVSIAMGAGVDIAKLHADMILLSNNLDVLNEAVALAARTRRIIRQNIGWAIAYNLLAIPIAASGLVPPWLAAIGMSLSSLIVVGNSIRLS